jgi:lipopolysaccharide export system protein LptA
VDPAGGTRTGSEPVIGAAGSFDYDDAAGRLTYTTTAHVNGPQGDLVADRIEMFMIEGTNELERVEAAEAVTLREDTRTATGAAMTYFSEGGRYDMSGAPVRIVEGCRESTGRSLTFYKTRDEVLIDGQRLLRTRTRNEGTCAEPAPVPGNRPRAGTRR